jgi:hypothetical protein
MGEHISILFQRNHAVGITVPMQLRGRRLAQHRQDQFNVVHVIAEVFQIQGFHLFLFLHFQAKGALHDFISQDSVFRGDSGTPMLPLIVLLN